MSGAQVINVDPYGPSTEFLSVHRRRLITQILKAIRRDKVSEGHGRGKFQFPSATWFSLWLSDMDCLEEVATAFDQNPRRVSGLYTMTGSFGRWPCVGCFLSYTAHLTDLRQGFRICRLPPSLRRNATGLKIHLITTARLPCTEMCVLANCNNHERMIIDTVHEQPL